MIAKTRGIVINYIKYKETSIIVKVFTEEYGMTSMIVNSVRSQKSKKSIGFFQPFSILELVAYIQPNRDLHRLSDWKYFHPTFKIQQNIYKSTIVLFLSEIISKILLNESDEHKPLFNYLLKSIITLDEITEGMENFHLHFLLKIMPFLGFGISDGESLLRSMELESIHNEPKVIELISRILRQSVFEKIETSGEMRFKVLETILSYYNHHDIHINEIKSLKVLHQVFR